MGRTAPPLGILGWTSQGDYSVVFFELCLPQARLPGAEGAARCGSPGAHTGFSADRLCKLRAGYPLSLFAQLQDGHESTYRTRLTGVLSEVHTGPGRQ